MSDLAVVDVDAVVEPTPTKSFAIVGPYRDRDAGTDASLAALLRAIPGSPDVIAGPAPSDACPSIINVRDSRLVMRSIADVDAVIIVTPSLGVDLSSATRLAQVACRARLRGQIVAFVGASAESPQGPAARWLARSAVHNADLTILRDEASADALVGAGVDPPLRIGADPAWQELGELFAAPDQNDNVVVALDDRFNDVDHLAAALGPVAASGFHVMLQPWTRTQPMAGPVAERVAERVGNNVSVIERPTSLREARDLYSTSRAVLALRFHAVMAAASAGSRTLTLGDGAMARLAKTLDLPVVSANSQSNDIAKALLKTLEHGPVGGRAVPQLIDRAKATVDLVRLLLTEGEDVSQSANNPLPLYPTPWR